MFTPQQIKDAISVLPSLSDDELINQYKCALSHTDSLKLKPFLTAVEQERKRRRKDTIIEEYTDELNSDA